MIVRQSNTSFLIKQTILNLPGNILGGASHVIPNPLWLRMHGEFECVLIVNDDATSLLNMKVAGSILARDRLVGSDSLSESLLVERDTVVDREAS